MKARADEVARVMWREDEASNQDGELVALFRGKSATVKGTWVE